jgi:hypothetical protein
VVVEVTLESLDAEVDSELVFECDVVSLCEFPELAVLDESAGVAVELVLVHSLSSDEDEPLSLSSLSWPAASKVPQALAKIAVATAKGKREVDKGRIGVTINK